MPTMPCKDLNELHPCLKRGAEEMLRRCKAQGLNVLITNTYRTKEYQNQLYAQGRTAPGNIVTYCKGGEGPHEFRIAFDFCKNVKGQEYNDNAFFKAVGKIWRDMGGEWGGDWKSFVDMPHCQYTGPYTDAQIRAGKVMPANQKMPWENVVKEDTELVQDMRINVNGKETVIKGIFKDGVNYPNLRALAELLGAQVDYDAAKKMPIVTLSKGGTN